MAEPQRFGKYQILERIASGGMAEVFKARLDGIGGFHRLFAIKRILPHLSNNPEFIDMLVDEAKIAGLLNHANIVQILDLGAVDGQYYIAMEYVHGRDLGQLLTRCAEKGITLPSHLAVYMVIEMLKGLEYAHGRGRPGEDGRVIPLNIVHRDISPANLLVSYRGEVKITDFGIAKASVKALQTQSGVIKGRFDYMSPEQASALPLDARSDLFSAGVVLYQLLTGRHPFRHSNKSEMATMEAIRKGNYSPPAVINPDIPPSLEQIVQTALAVDPAGRYQSATQFKDALDKFAHDMGLIGAASQLSRFLKELSPEGERGRDADELQLDEPLPDPPTVPPGQPSGTEESTLIRPLPKTTDWGEMQTVIRNEGRAASMAAAPAAPVAALPRPEARSRIVYRTPSYIHVVYIIVAVTVLVVGLAGGAVLATWIGDARPELVQRAPVLQVYVPVGTQVSINGKPLTGTPPYEATVVAGTETVLRVEQPNLAPIEAKVNLNYNELRIISFNPISLQPKPQK